jgi:hypothetical protein
MPSVVVADFMLNLIADSLTGIPKLVAAWASGRSDHQKASQTINYIARNTDPPERTMLQFLGFSGGCKVRV